jgi:hypothetical protein
MTATFHGRIRQWRDDKPGGLAVRDFPDELVGDLGAAARCG